MHENVSGEFLWNHVSIVRAVPDTNGSESQEGWEEINYDVRHQTSYFIAWGSLNTVGAQIIHFLFPKKCPSRPSPHLR